MNWETASKACGAVAAICSTLGLVIGGGFALYTYRLQVASTQELKVKELLQIEYQQKREIYYRLLNAAATFASSPDLESAKQNEARYWAIYLGKAHAVVTEESVIDAKIAFGRSMKKAMIQRRFPNNSAELKNAALTLSEACRDALIPDAFFQKRFAAQKL